jgi:tetratricopeptide (TPR) repeat protein
MKNRCFLNCIWNLSFHNVYTIVNHFTQEEFVTEASEKLQLIEALNIDSNDLAALLLIGHTLYEQGRLDGARNIFEGLMVLDSKNIFVTGILGAIYQKQEQYGTALECYDRALNLFPGDIHSLTNRAEIHLRLGSLEEAAADFRKAIEMDPERKHPAGNRARLLVELTMQCLQTAKQK